MQKKYIILNILCLITLLSASCIRNKSTIENSEESIPIDTSTAIDVPVIIDSDTIQEIDYQSEEYSEGILPIIEMTSPEYAERLRKEGNNGFIIVDKASMRVILYDKYGIPLKKYGMACAKNYGTKHSKGDSRTPEGYFSVEGVYDSTDWLFTDDNGVTSKKKGQFGPRFIRIKIPTTSQIGIHGTCSPWSIGHRTSHGCIRIENENILELVNLVHIGMPVIILPGKRDRQVNREEGYNIVYFPTEPKYAISNSEKTATYNVKTEEATDSTENHSISTSSDIPVSMTDSINNNVDKTEVKESEENKEKAPNE